MVEEEYELIPVSPIRKLEKRLDRIERTATSSEILNELMDIIKTNQQVVDSMAKTNSVLISKVTDLSNAVDKLIAKVDDFLSRVEVGEEIPEESKTEERIAKLEKRINAMLLSSVAKRRPEGQQPRIQPKIGF